MVQGGGERLQVLTDVSGVTSAAHASSGDSEEGSNKGCLFAILGPSGSTTNTASCSVVWSGWYWLLLPYHVSAAIHDSLKVMTRAV